MSKSKDPGLSTPEHEPEKAAGVISASLGHKLLRQAPLFFKNDPATIIDEMIQNARRAGATQISFRKKGNDLEIHDDGHGIAQDQAHVLLTLGGSHNAQAIEEAEMAAGIGFFSLAHYDILVRSQDWLADINKDVFIGNEDSLIETGKADHIGTTITVRNFFLSNPKPLYPILAERAKYCPLSVIVEKMPLSDGQGRLTGQTTSRSLPQAPFIKTHARAKRGMIHYLKLPGLQLSVERAPHPVAALEINFYGKIISYRDADDIPSHLKPRFDFHEEVGIRKSKADRRRRGEENPDSEDPEQRLNMAIDVEHYYWQIRIDVTSVACFKLRLPDRDALVNLEGLQDIREKIEAVIAAMIWKLSSGPAAASDAEASSDSKQMTAKQSKPEAEAMHGTGDTKAPAARQNGVPWNSPLRQLYKLPPPSLMLRLNGLVKHPCLVSGPKSKLSISNSLGESISPSQLITCLATPHLQAMLPAAFTAFGQRYYFVEERVAGYLDLDLARLNELEIRGENSSSSFVLQCDLSSRSALDTSLAVEIFNYHRVGNCLKGKAQKLENVLTIAWNGFAPTAQQIEAADEASADPKAKTPRADKAQPKTTRYLRRAVGMPADIWAMPQATTTAQLAAIDIDKACQLQPGKERQTAATDRGDLIASNVSPEHPQRYTTTLCLPCPAVYCFAPGQDMDEIYDAMGSVHAILSDSYPAEFLKFVLVKSLTREFVDHYIAQGHDFHEQTFQNVYDICSDWTNTHIANTFEDQDSITRIIEERMRKILPLIMRNLSVKPGRYDLHAQFNQDALVFAKFTQSDAVAKNAADGHQHGLKPLRGLRQHMARMKAAKDSADEAQAADVASFIEAKITPMLPEGLSPIEALSAIFSNALSLAFNPDMDKEDTAKQPSKAKANRGAAKTKASQSQARPDKTRSGKAAKTPAAATKPAAASARSKTLDTGKTTGAGKTTSGARQTVDRQPKPRKRA